MRSLTDLEYSYSDHDVWPGDEATVALCIFLHPGPLGGTTLDLLTRPLRKSISKIMDLQLTNQIAVFVTSVLSKVFN